MIDKFNNLQKIYAELDGSVRRKGLNRDSSEPIYASYLNLIKSNIELNGKSVLDIGCGSGWSSFFISKFAKKVIGLDLHKNGYEPDSSDNLEFKTGSAEQLDFDDEIFDVVTTNECLEHVPHPDVALTEFDRVLKPGGYVVISGPNLFSLLQSLRGLTQYVWSNRPLYTIFYRSPSLPKHPHGNTFPEILVNLFKNLYFITKLYWMKKPLFKRREPDLIPPFHADNDACYYLNPLDLKYFFESKGYTVVTFSKNRPGFMAMMPSGTGFVARKPETSKKVYAS
ncbi:MAG: class I SAM-dependent methyltransferase [Bdellovibrionales bacterium]|nr:class I SAM-dependent methyltransferase [Bdellovibrionales bacterium]